MCNNCAQIPAGFRRFLGPVFYDPFSPMYLKEKMPLAYAVLTGRHPDEGMRTDDQGTFGDGLLNLVLESEMKMNKKLLSTSVAAVVAAMGMGVTTANAAEVVATAAVFVARSGSGCRCWCTCGVR